MLEVSSLGKFQITDGQNILNDDILRSDMLKKLLVYILTHREHPISVQELSDALWQEDETDNPTGALKNLMYRLRNILKKTFGQHTYIITSPGAYSWNREIEINLDAEDFVECCERAKRAASEEKAVREYEKALALYKGEFVDNVLDKHWAITLSTYYHSLFLSATKGLAQLYDKTGRYEEMERLCMNGLKYDQVDEQLYCYHIQSLIRQNKFKLAMKHYEEASKVLYDALGVRNSTKFREVYQELLKMNKGAETERLETISRDMEEKEEPVGVYLCTYPVFREIYRLEARKIGRLGTAEYVVLFTVKLKDGIKTENAKMEKFILDKAMVQLEDTLKEKLRIGDVASRYSNSQFIVLLPTCTYESSLVVTKRILSGFAEKNKNDKIMVKTDYEQVTRMESALVK